MRVRGNLFAATVELPAEGVYYISNPSLPNYPFGAVYYGLTVDDQGVYVMPNTAFPLGYNLNTLNNIPTPVICQRCMSGPTCDTPVINTCACNPCDNFDDVCSDSSDPRTARECTEISDTTGNPFTLMYMQNRDDNTEDRELVGLSIYLHLFVGKELNRTSF